MAAFSTNKGGWGGGTPETTLAGRLNISAGPAQAIPIQQLLKNLIGPNSISNSALAQMPAASFKCNPSTSIANAQDCTIQGLTFSASPDANNDRVLVYSASTGELYSRSPGNLAAGGTAGVTSLGGLTGVVGLEDGLKVTGSNLDLGNGLSTSGGTLAASLGAGLAFSGSNIAWTATTAPYTSARTGGVSQTVQSRFDSGILYSSDFGTTCDGTTSDATAMDKFLAAVAVSPSKMGIVTGTSTNSVCNMAGSQFLIRPGTSISCGKGLTLKFALNSALVTPYGSHSGRTYQGKFSGCLIDGTSSTTYPSSISVDLYDASDWIVSDVFIMNVNIGVAVQGRIAAYYNRISNVTAYQYRSYGYYFDGNANSNDFIGVRATSGGLYGFYCRGNQNTIVGAQVEAGFVDAFTSDGNCTANTITGLRMENVPTGGTEIRFVSGAYYNTVVGACCQSLSGTSYINSGTGNTKTGGYY